MLALDGRLEAAGIEPIHAILVSSLEATSITGAPPVGDQVARLTAENVRLAEEMIGQFPRPKSALIPLLHLAQQQDGYVTDEAMRHVAELTGTTPAEVKGTATFYEMFKFEPVGSHLVNICTNISCLVLGGEELLHHAEETLGVKVGGTTADGVFTLQDVECIAACTEAPCVQVNYRYRHRVTHDDFDQLIDDIRAGRLGEEIPEHGTLARVRQAIPVGRAAGVKAPEDAREAPAWLARNDSAGGDG